MLAGFERGNGKFWMRMSRRADIDHLYRGIGEQVGEIAISLHLGHVQFERCARPTVARDRGKIAVEIAAAGIAEGGDAAGVDLTVGFEVRGGHEAKADNPHPDRLSRFAFCVQCLIPGQIERDSRNCLAAQMSETRWGPASRSMQ